jgi:hypothetical protein
VDVGTRFTETVKAGVLVVAKGMAETPPHEQPDLISILNNYVGDDIRNEVAEYIWLRFLEVNPWVARELAKA